MASNIKKFNMTIGNLIDDLLVICNNKFNHLEVFKTQFELLKSVNPRKIIEQFLINIQPYKEKIKSRDEKFFIEKNYKEDVDKNVSDESYSQSSLDEILNLKLIWNTLDDSNKSIIWDYFNVLVKLTELEYNK